MDSSYRSVQTGAVSAEPYHRRAAPIVGCQSGRSRQPRCGPVRLKIGMMSFGYNVRLLERMAAAPA